MSFAIASSVKYSEICQNFSNSVVYSADIVSNKLVSCMVHLFPSILENAKTCPLVRQLFLRDFFTEGSVKVKFTKFSWLERDKKFFLTSGQSWSFLILTYNSFEAYTQKILRRESDIKSLEPIKKGPAPQYWKIDNLKLQKRFHNFFI